MVSLLNYKTVDSEIQQQSSTGSVAEVPSGNGYSSQSLSIGLVESNHQRESGQSRGQGEQLEQQQDRFFAHIRRYDSSQQSSSISNQEESDLASTVIVCGSVADEKGSSERVATTILQQTSAINSNNDSNKAIMIPTVDYSEVETSRTSQAESLATTTNIVLDGSDTTSEKHLPRNGTTTTIADDCRKPDFVVTWRNLNFVIEPKWHQKLAHNTRAALTNCKPVQSPKKDSGTSFDLALVSSATAPQSPDNGAAVQVSMTNTTRVVLDKLDGSFKSGELTAILGPSGRYS